MNIHPHVELARQLRFRLADQFHPIAVIGTAAAEMSVGLRQFGYRRLWQREAPDAVLSLYQPGRLFDAVVLTGCLEHLIGDLPAAGPELYARAFDQIQASLAGPGLVCVSVPHAPASDDGRAFSTESLSQLFASHGFATHLTSTYLAPPDDTPTLTGIFRPEKPYLGERAAIRIDASQP